MRGRFIFFPGSKKELIVPNQIVDEGEASILKMICRDDQTDVPGGNDFYIGLCGNVNGNDLTLATLTGEPSSVGGYARKAVERSAIGWPTLGKKGGFYRMATGIIDFTASAANFSVPIRRAFLCNVISGSSGILYSVSGAYPDNITVEDGDTLSLVYELFVR